MFLQPLLSLPKSKLKTDYSVAKKYTDNGQHIFWGVKLIKEKKQTTTLWGKIKFGSNFILFDNQLFINLHKKYRDGFLKGVSYILNVDVASKFWESWMLQLLISIKCLA